MIDVVVATHRRPKGLGRLLDALERQTLGPNAFHVVVVNDGSPGEEYEAALAAPGANASPDGARDGSLPLADRRLSLGYIALDRRRGPAAARNAGVAASTAPLIVFTDDDCIPPPGWLERVRRRFESPDAPDALGGPVVPIAPGPLGAIDRYLLEVGFLQPRLGGVKPACLPTANLALTREWFARVGGFDERFRRAGGEDLDVTRRLQAAGARLDIDEGWTNRHEGAMTLGSFCKRFFRYGYGGALHARYRGDFPPPAPTHLPRAPGTARLRSPRTGGPPDAEIDRRHRRYRWSFLWLGLLRHSAYRLGGLWALKD